MLKQSTHLVLLQVLTSTLNTLVSCQLPMSANFAVVIILFILPHLI